MAELLIEGGSKALLDFFTAAVSAYVVVSTLRIVLCGAGCRHGACGQCPTLARLGAMHTPLTPAHALVQPLQQR